MQTMEKRSVSQDQFFDGEFEVLQPEKGGHRSGIDALLLAASLPKNAEGYLADFGAGCGVAAMAALAHNDALHADLVEVEPEMTELCKDGLKLPCNSKFFNRVKIIEADATLTGEAREAVGLTRETYDYVIMNPPYNDTGYRPSPYALKKGAHMMGHAGLDPWIRSACACLKPNGKIFIITRPTAIGLIVAAFQGRFGGAKFLPIHSYKDEPATKLIATAQKGTKTPLEFLPPFVVHQDDGSYTPEADAIFHGQGLIPQMQK